MNQRNVDALADLLTGARGFIKNSYDLARHLASEGVLVPSSLTDEETQKVAEDEQEAKAIDRSTANKPDDVRGELERIAKGEDA